MKFIKLIFAIIYFSYPIASMESARYNGAFLPHPSSNFDVQEFITKTSDELNKCKELLHTQGQQISKLTASLSKISNASKKQDEENVKKRKLPQDEQAEERKEYEIRQSEDLKKVQQDFFTYQQNTEGRLLNIKNMFEGYVKVKEEQKSRLNQLEERIGQLVDDMKKKEEEKVKRRKLKETEQELKKKYDESHRYNLEQIRQYLVDHNGHIQRSMQQYFAAFGQYFKERDEKQMLLFTEMKSQSEQDLKKVIAILEKKDAVDFESEFSKIPDFQIPSVDEGGL